MKVSINLPRFNKLSNSFMLDAHRGVIEGWSNLPPNIQKVVEWTGLEFVNGGGVIQIETKIAQAPYQAHLRQEASFSVANSGREEVEVYVEKKFRETVLELIEKLKKSLTQDVQSLENLLK